MKLSISIIMMHGDMVLPENVLAEHFRLFRVGQTQFRSQIQNLQLDDVLL